MENHIDESRQDDHGLDNLSPDKKKETEDILNEINKDNEDKTKKTEVKDGELQKSKEEEQKKAEETAAKAKADEEAAKKAEEDKKTEGKKKSEERRPWKQAIAEKRKEQLDEKDTKIAELEATVAKLTGSAKTDKDDESKSKEATDSEIKGIVDTIVAKHKVEDPAVIEDLLTAVAAYVKNKTAIPQEIADKLKDVDTLKSRALQDEVKIEEANFSNDFDTLIKPLITAEYGEDIPADKVAEIKKALKDIAYTAEYANVPYEEIYLGKKDFRELHTPKKRSAEGGRSGSSELTNSEGNYTDELSEEEVAKLSPEEFEKYGNAMAALERSRK